MTDVFVGLLHCWDTLQQPVTLIRKRPELTENGWMDGVLS